MGELVIVSRKTIQLSLFSVLALAACDSGSGPRTIEKTRIVQPKDLAGIDRAGGREPAMGRGFQEPRELAKNTGNVSPSSPRVHFTLPDGWLELPASSMRIANFTLSSDERVECYLTLLGGEAGGLTANVNRWRGQMGLAPLAPDEVASMETFNLLGRRAAQLDLVGTWSGMGGGASEAGWRMLGLLAVSAGGSSFLKMVGPEKVVAAEKDHFLELAASMHDGSGHAHGDTPTASAPAPEPVRSEAADGQGGEVPAPPRSVSSGLAWRSPEDWVVAPERAFRNANYFAGSEDVEAYVTVLPGDAGGTIANVNRWRAQMGQPPLTPTDFDDLARVSMLGGSGILIEIAGSFQSMSGSVLDDALMIGALIQIPGRSVFVKMIGPSELVVQQRQPFLEFCESLDVVSDG